MKTLNTKIDDNIRDWIVNEAGKKKQTIKEVVNRLLKIGVTIEKRYCFNHEDCWVLERQDEALHIKDKCCLLCINNLDNQRRYTPPRHDDEFIKGVNWIETL